MMQQQMMGGAGANADPGKMFVAEREALHVTDHTWALENIESELLASRF